MHLDCYVKYKILNICAFLFWPLTFSIPNLILEKYFFLLGNNSKVPF